MNNISKITRILLILVVLIFSLTACEEQENISSNDNISTQTKQNTSIDEVDNIPKK